MQDLFRLADRFGAGPSRVHGEVWQRLHGRRPPPQIPVPPPTRPRPPPTPLRRRWRSSSRRTAARTSGPRWPDGSTTAQRPQPRRAGRGRARRRAHRRAAHLAGPVRPLPHRRRHGHPTARPHACARRSPPPSCYFHRYLLDLEPRHAARRRRRRGRRRQGELRQWWDWMRNYRVWEANRKVFLYPENYLRPELRDAKTPAFARAGERPAAGRDHAGVGASAPTSATWTSTPRSPG